MKNFNTTAVCVPSKHYMVHDILPPVTIYLPLVPGSQPEAWDISLPKLYNMKAMA